LFSAIAAVIISHLRTVASKILSAGVLIYENSEELIEKELSRIKTVTNARAFKQRHRLARA
jgi:hypothetical protein